MTLTGLSPTQTSLPGGAEVLRLDEWQRHASQVFVPLAVDPEVPSEFEGRLSGLAIPEATAVRLEAGAHQVERSAAHVRAGGSGYFKFSLQMGGRGVVSQGGRESTVKPGDITVYDTSRPYTLTFDRPNTQFVLMVPQERFGSAVSDVEDLVATRLGVGGLADVVVPVLTGVAQRLRTGQASVGAALIHHAVDLVETMCRDDAERFLAASEDLPRGAKDNELRRVVRYIDEQLGDPRLSPQAVAAAHFMSVRSLYKLFDESGTTVAALIRSRRMERAMEALSHPGRVDVPIGRIGTECGLPDAAHFSRLFRSTFGISPTQVRNRALGVG
ncbi:helix-turn-helix domain-containing protein [Galactobacter sp.]|uniref:AraC-like ligand-binding domain-containing protein n=1 Tax=Galactobacter sp. TaxID=2676125 RepID=UPI0025B8587F|nr:helix-turn-helix domain-containing protein [Galactobacter sp.]